MRYNAYTYEQSETIFQWKSMDSDVEVKYRKLNQIERVRQARAHNKTFPREQRRNKS